MAEISIIVPIYKVEQYIEQCIESIINQTFKDIEIILVDDGSPDNCGMICDEYARRDNRIRVIHKENGGLVSARKAGLKIANGKYVGFVDGDDWIEAGMYSHMYNIIKKYGVSVVETGVIDTYNDYEKIRRPYFEAGEYRDEKFDERIVPQLICANNFYQNGLFPYTCSKIFLKDKFYDKYKKINDKCGQLEDAASVYPYIIKESNIYVSNECFYHYRVNNNSLKRNINDDEYSKITQNLLLIKTAIEESRYKNELLRQYYYMVIYHYIWMAPWLFDRKNILQAFGGIKNNSKVILYGAGAVGINLYKYLKTKTNIEIIDWVDQHYQKLKLDLPVSNPCMANYEKADYVIISVLRYSAKEEIIKNLMDMGVVREKIRWIEREYLNDPKKLIEYSYKYIDIM